MDGWMDGRVGEWVGEQSSKLHAAIGHFPCALLERPTIIPRVRFQRPIKCYIRAKCTVYCVVGG